MKTLIKNKWLITILLLAMFIVSLLCFLRWKRDYEVFYGEYCPDHYCEYADTFYNFFNSRDYDSYTKLDKFFQNRYISFSPIVPILTGGINLFIGNTIVSYSIVSFLFSLGTIFIFYKLISIHLKLPSQMQLISVALLSFNILFIRAFLRPITDSAGLFFTFSSLYLVLDITKNFSYKKLFYYSLFILLALFSRVSVLPIVGFIIIWFILKFLQKRDINLLESALSLGILPIVLFLITGAAFGFLPMIPKAWDVAHSPGFLLSYNLYDLIKVLVVSLQFYPFVWVFGLFKKKFLRTEAEQFHFLWILFYLAFLIIGKGALWNRYLLPIVPSIIFISLNSLQALSKKSKILFLVFITGTFLFNILPLILQIINPSVWKLNYIINFFH